jgi:hypothetical protein
MSRLVETNSWDYRRWNPVDGRLHALSRFEGSGILQTGKKVICNNWPGFDQLNGIILQMLMADKLKAAIANSNDKPLNWPVARKIKKLCCAAGLFVTDVAFFSPRARGSACRCQ